MKKKKKKKRIMSFTIHMNHEGDELTPNYFRCIK